MPQLHLTRALLALCAFVAGVSWAGAAQAAFINGSFETGFGGWGGAGDIGIAGGVLGFGPTQGTNLALVTTFSNAGDGGNLFGADAIAAAVFEGALGLAPGTIASPTGALGTEGSMIGQVITEFTGGGLL